MILIGSATAQIKPLNVKHIKKSVNKAAKWLQYTTQSNPAISSVETHERECPRAKLNQICLST